MGRPSLHFGKGCHVVGVYPSLSIAHELLNIMQILSDQMIEPSPSSLPSRNICHSRTMQAEARQKILIGYRCDVSRKLREHQSSLQWQLEPQRAQLGPQQPSPP